MYNIRKTTLRKERIMRKYLLPEEGHFYKANLHCHSNISDGSLTPEQIKETVIRHANLQLQYKGEYTAVREMRKHLAWYTVGYPNSAKFRQMINSMETMDELLKSVDLIF